MSLSFQGTGVALVTPFKNNVVDFDGLKDVIEHTLAGGVDYIVSLGTTGETPTLSANEQLEVLDFTIKVVEERVPIVAGFGGNNTAAIIKAIQSHDFDGVDAILSSSPAYNKPTQEGIFQHYMAIEAVAPRPIIIYNVPGRTSRNITAETTLRLARASEKFVAIKEASGNLHQCMKIMQGKPASFLLLSGDDNLTLPMMACGAKGVISVVANAFPRPFSSMVKACLKGNFDTAKDLHYTLLNITDLLFIENNPAGVKAALKILGICREDVRLPIIPVTEATYQQLKLEIRKL